VAVTDAKNRVTQRELETLLLEMELADGYQPQEYTLDAIDWTKVLYPVDMPLRVVSLDAPRTRTEYSKDGRVLAEIDELGNRTQYEYNPLGQLTKVTYPEVEGNSSSISTEYDSAGRRIKETDALGNTVEYKYDKLGRAIEVIFEDESSNQTTFDSLGRRTQSIDQEGIITEYEYDKLGRLSAVVQKVSQTEIGTRYDYNELGQLVAATDAKKRVTKYEYDDAGCRVAVVLPGGERASTTYDELGNIASYTDFNGETTQYEYDADNRLVVKDLEEDIDVEYTYTEDGQVATIKDSRGTTEFEYDELGYLLWRKDPDGKVISYEYDEIGNITKVETPAGVVAYEYDSWNRLQKVVEGTEETSYRYDEVGNLIETIFPNGTVERREYDELYRLTNVQVVDSDDTLLSEFKYELNEAGHRTQVKEKVRQPDGSLSERTVEYEYDELYRLIEAAVWGGETITYRYDEVGNRISAGARSYVYDDNDRLIEEREGGEVVVSYSYDDNGNLLSRTEGNETVDYVWDDQNRLVKVDDIEFEYDDDNIRVSQTVGGEKTSFLLDKNRPYAQVLAEYTNGSLDASYVYGLDLISQERNGEDWFYFVDGLGSTRGLTDATGEVTDAYWYDAYGNLLEHEGSSENDYLFAGEQFDEALGQYYLRQRYYDPATGRFTRRDTWEGDRTNPITLNKYLYANGNPVSYIDPSGLAAASIQELTVTIALLATLAALYYSQVSITSSGAIFGSLKSINDFLDLHLPMAASQRGKQGDVGDSGIRREAEGLVDSGEAEDIEEALNILKKQTGNRTKEEKARQQKIKSEQKNQQIRKSRQKKDNNKKPKENK